MKRTRSGYGSGSSYNPKRRKYATPKKRTTRTFPIPSLMPSGSEIKWVDITSESYSFAATAGDSTSIILLNQIEQGVNTCNRIGNRVELKSLHINGHIDQNILTITGGQTPDFLRWAIVYDRAPETRGGTLPLYEEIFGEKTANGDTSCDVFSGVNLDNKDRFVILRNKTCQGPGNFLSASPAISLGEPIQGEVGCKNSFFVINEHIKLDGLLAQYNGTGDTITVANITTGALYFMTQGIFSTGGSAPDIPTWEMNCNFRLKYKDL